MSDLEIISKEIDVELAKAEIQKALIETTFKGLSLTNMRKALFEGMARGFAFKDFLEKNVYAISYGTNYSLVTSIDYARKLGMRGGVCGKSAPVYEDKDGAIITCAITVKRNVAGVVGEYTAKVYFSEYTTGRNLWLSKPRTMIAKVAEMHALRMACPEELAKAYVEEEMQKEIAVIPEINIGELVKQLRDTKNADELKKVWVSIPAKAKVELKQLKDELKNQYENTAVQK